MERTCQYCDRRIVEVGGQWVDPEAAGDDIMWRETCDCHDTFEADHEPVPANPKDCWTPGPWTYSSGSVWAEGDGFTEPCGIRIGGADRNEGRTSPAERDANARLMAAAPELLQATRRVAEEFALRIDVPPDFEPFRQSLLRAIEKATVSV